MLISAALEDDPIGTIQSLETYLAKKISRKKSGMNCCTDSFVVLMIVIERNMLKNLSEAHVVEKRKLTLEDRVRRKWSKPADKLPIAIDIPRLLRRIELITSDGDVIVSKE